MTHYSPPGHMREARVVPKWMRYGRGQAWREGIVVHQRAPRMSCQTSQKNRGCRNSGETTILISGHGDHDGGCLFPRTVHLSRRRRRRGRFPQPIGVAGMAPSRPLRFGLFFSPGMSFRSIFKQISCLSRYKLCGKRGWLKCT